MARLLEHSKWSEVKWHGWRQRGAVILFQAGGHMSPIKAWFRWRSTATAQEYMECPDEDNIKLVLNWLGVLSPVQQGTPIQQIRQIGCLGHVAGHPLQG